MRTKEQIYLDMVDSMPFKISSNVGSYVTEAMQIYATEYHQSKVKENELCFGVSKPFFCNNDDESVRCKEQCLGCDGFERDE